MAVILKLDPDLQFLVRGILTKRVSSDNLFILHVNCRSFDTDFDQLSNLLLSISSKPSLIAVSETWLSVNTEKLYSTPDYNFFFTNSRVINTRGVEVGFFIMSSILYN